jgi:DNA-directed RNA polymerase subunit M/transcription elongation factor TFIIS
MGVFRSIQQWYANSIEQQNAQEAAIVCPHCHERGGVETEYGKQKRGISGGKATASVLSGGFSILATGLSRKQEVTFCTCRNCGMDWVVE